LKEVFMVVGAPQEMQQELLMSCPGVSILSYMLVAETRLHTHGVSDGDRLRRTAATMVNMVGDIHARILYSTWPMHAAEQRYEETKQKVALTAGRAPVLDIVIPHCREEMTWLRDTAHIPARTRLFVYEKCGQPGNFSDLHSRSKAVFSGLGDAAAKFESIEQIDLSDGIDATLQKFVRRDECNAYLSHVVNNYDNLGDYTAFVHGTPSDHLTWDWFNLVMRMVDLGAYDVPYLHLSSPRLVMTVNPCQDYVFETAFGRKLEEPIGAYCCSQFLVSRTRILEQPREYYEKILTVADGTIPDHCERIGPSYEKYAGQRLAYCYQLEFMWHHVFGEPIRLPLRSEDPRLPLALRMKDRQESLPLWKEPFLRSIWSG
jgi:hypothetical protein